MMHSLHILLLSAASSEHTVKWANVFVTRGHKVSLVTCSDHRPVDGELDDRVRVHYLPFPARLSLGYFLNAPFLGRIARVLAPDVVNVHYASGYGTLGRLSRVQNSVLSVWGSDVFDFPEKGRLAKSLVLANLRYAKGIAATTPAMAQRVQELLANDTLPVAITPFGVELTAFHTTLRARRDSPLVVGAVKNLKKIYGFSVLIDAVRELKERAIIDPRGHALRVMIYGDGPERLPLMEQAARYGLSEVIHLPGRVPHSEVPRVLDSLDIFVSPSLRESFGVSVIEAMAAHLPVIVSDSTGIASALTHAEDSLIVPSGDSSSLAAALELLLSDSRLRQRLAFAGRRRAERDFDFSINADELLRLLSHVSRCRS